MPQLKTKIVPRQLQERYSYFVQQVIKEQNWQEKVDREDLVISILSRMKKKPMQIVLLVHRFGLAGRKPESFLEMSKRFHCSVESVRQQVVGAIEKAKSVVKEHQLA